MRIEIICTGDEILTGKTINTNFSHISRKLEEAGLAVRWGTTVGDDPDTLLEAFHQAAARADAVIVNGGLGPTVDDLSQEIAAKAAGVGLILHEPWLERIEAMFRGFGVAMQPNNRKQALLPQTAELIDNPIGTACGFALDIGGARFYFTPGVPRELHLMLEAQIIPRLLARAGMVSAILVKRFHVFGIGESHADLLLEGIEKLAPEGGIKLGFQTHYPQLETKLSLRGADADELAKRLAPVAAELRRRLGNFIVAEDDETLEAVVMAALAAAQASLVVVEGFTCGLAAARLAQVPGAETVLRRGVFAPSGAELEHILGLEGGMLASGKLTEKALAKAARAALAQTGASHAVVVLAEDDPAKPAAPVFWFAIATAERVEIRVSHPRLTSGGWLRTGAVEMALDSLRRFLQGLPVVEKIDFENA